MQSSSTATLASHPNVSHTFLKTQSHLLRSLQAIHDEVDDINISPLLNTEELDDDIVYYTRTTTSTTAKTPTSNGPNTIPSSTSPRPLLTTTELQ